MARLNREEIMMRAHKEFKKELEEIQRIRIVKGIDSPNPKERAWMKDLTGGIPKSPVWPNLKEWLSNAPRRMKDDKKANLTGLFASGAGLITFIILVFILVVIAAFFTKAFGIVTDSLTTLPNQNNVTNVSYYAQVTFGNLNTSLQQLHWISLILIFGMMMGVLLANYLIKVHPAWFGAYLSLAVVAVILSIILANSYEKLYTNTGFIGQSLQAYSEPSWIVLYLPIWVTVIAFIGAIFLFVRMNNGEDSIL